LTAIPSFTADPNELLYNPLAHPEARLASGRLLVSYSRNNLDFNRLLEDADYYGLRFVEVSLAGDRPQPREAPGTTARTDATARERSWRSDHRTRTGP
jgi:hypothetical protein